jgi:hypothetical protein
LSRVYIIAIKELPETIRFVDILRPDPALRLTPNGATPKMEVRLGYPSSDIPARADLQFAQAAHATRSVKIRFRTAPRFRTRVERIGVEEVVIAQRSPSAKI